MHYRFLILPIFLCPVPAAASTIAAGGIQISEPSNMALMALGLAGVIIGRRAARSKRSGSDDTHGD